MLFKFVIFKNDKLKQRITICTNTQLQVFKPPTGARASIKHLGGGKEGEINYLRGNAKNCTKHVPVCHSYSEVVKFG